MNHTMQKNHYTKDLKKLTAYRDTLSIIGYSVALFAAVGPFFLFLIN